MNLRAALILFVLAFIGLLIVMGVLSFVRWLKMAYPGQFRSILVALCLGLVILGIWGYMEASHEPAFHAGDLLTLQEPVVARLVSTDRNSPTQSCIVDLYKHLSVVEIQMGTLRARVESNTSGSSFCPHDADVQIELAWLHRYTLTHRHS